MIDRFGHLAPRDCFLRAHPLPTLLFHSFLGLLRREIRLSTLTPALLRSTGLIPPAVAVSCCQPDPDVTLNAPMYPPGRIWNGFVILFPKSNWVLPSALKDSNHVG